MGDEKDSREDGRNVRGLTLILNGSRSEKALELEMISREIKFTLLAAIAGRERRDLAPVPRAWFRHEVRAVRTAINRTLQRCGQRTLPHPRRGSGKSR